jgi:hypothetical protein
MTALVPALSLDLSLGAIELGCLIAALLYGMFLVQLYMYALSCAKDRRWLKLLVALVWFVLIYIIYVCVHIVTVFSGFWKPCIRYSALLSLAPELKPCSDFPLDVHLQSERPSLR